MSDVATDRKAKSQAADGDYKAAKDKNQGRRDANTAGEAETEAGQEGVEKGAESGAEGEAGGECCPQACQGFRAKDEVCHTGVESPQDRLQSRDETGSIASSH